MAREVRRARLFCRTFALLGACCSAGCSSEAHPGAAGSAALEAAAAGATMEQGLPQDMLPAGRRAGTVSQSAGTGGVAGTSAVGSGGSSDVTPDCMVDAPDCPQVDAEPEQPIDPAALCDHEAAYAPLVEREGETCYRLTTHGGNTVDDTTPFMIAPGESDVQFYFRAPWPTGAQATRYGTELDNIAVLHHWALFTTAKPVSLEGMHEVTVGSVFLDSAQLLAGWAVGDCTVEFPEELGFELPAQGAMLNVQWHYFNNTGEPQPDTSSVQVCTVPEGTRPNTGSLTWLGTENFNGPLGMPARTRSEFSGTCTNDSGAPITIWGFWPHMHKLGRTLRSTINRLDGTSTEVFNRPFDFNYQVHYKNVEPVVLAPGESITSTCTFENDTDAAVPFGPSTTQEMCYQFAFAYPARALDNNVFSLVGATNTCW